MSATGAGEPVDLRRAGLGPTYRLQLHPGFGFDDAARVVPYLAQLGIATAYLSPIAEAVPGSTHGYDGIDPTRLRAELGGDAGFHALVDACRAHGLGICVDHVPNHLAAWAGGGWWRRLLAEGPDSFMGEVFDVDWDAAAPAGAAGTPGAAGSAGAAGRKVTLPILDRPLEVALRDGRIRVTVRGDESVIEVGEPGATGVDLPVSGGPVRPDDGVEDVLASQHYRLVDWHDSADRNYRRFFDIDGLAGVRVEVPEVFDATHALLLSLAESGELSAIRIDHVDGLRDPTAYLRRLAARTGLPIVVEKILTGDERLRADWPVRGTTGYEVVDDIGGVLVDPHGYDRLVAAGRSEGDDEVERLTVETRRLVATTSFPGELARCAAQLGVEAAALREAVARLPRYRTYLSAASSSGGAETAAPEDGALDDGAIGGAELERDEVAVWRSVVDHGAADDAEAVVEAVLDPRRRTGALGLQQLTGALMAKGVEDTAWYRLAGPLAFCEVGGDPGRSRHDAMSRWHARAAQRVDDEMPGLVPGTTHDTKRALDVRCRLYALSEMSTAFNDGLERFREQLRTALPAADDESLFYETRVLAQLALGILPPLPPGSPGSPEHMQAPGDAAWPEKESAVAERLGDALVKGAREAKRRSSWQAPDETYEAHLAALAGASMADGGAILRSSFGPVVDEVARLGAVGSLSAVVLRHCAPGIPDCYQGDEVWNLSLVDPDNRRPVDFEQLLAALSALGTGDDAVSTWHVADERRRAWRDGTVKLFVTARCLAARRGPAGAALAPEARYHPLAASGPASTSVLAFAREASLETGETVWAVPVVTRLPGRLSATGDDLPVGASYADTDLRLPDGAPSRFVDMLSGRTVVAHDGAVFLDEVLEVLPVAILAGASGPSGALRPPGARLDR